MKEFDQEANKFNERKVLESASTSPSTSDNQK